MIRDMYQIVEEGKDEHLTKWNEEQFTYMINSLHQLYSGSITMTVNEGEITQIYLITEEGKDENLSRLNDEQLTYVIESLHDLDFGSINITVHEGKITQIDTVEKKRFPAKAQSKRQKQYNISTEN